MLAKRFILLLGLASIGSVFFPNAASCATSIQGTWSFVGDAPTVFHSVATLAKGSGDTVLAGGGDSGVAVWTATNGCQAMNIARWTNNRWSPLGSGIHMIKHNGIRGIAIAPDGSLHIGGDFDSAGGLPARYYAWWNGAEWNTDDNGFFIGPIDALVFAKDGTMYFAIGTAVRQKRGNEWSDISPNVGSVSDYTVEINAMAVRTESFS
jgi:hypothetical protein